ncbi:MAG: SDR family NAD(P)-dependent oxidoreductase [Oligoflexia bacterium]|nr:SDR family NAD(P)-dependent oxidoreductase [Oligoflexia bacterium]
MKKVFITGSSTGIGWQLAQDYHAEGWKVGVCARNLAKLPEGWEEKFPNMKAYEVDVKKKELLKEVIADFSQGSLDLVIANAGRSHGSKTTRPDFDVSRDIIEINVLGVLNTFDAALNVMWPNRQGHLVAIASVAGMVGLPGASAYSASKAAVIKMCESYHMDLKQYGIDVTTICPGFIDTPLTQQNDHAMPFLMKADKASRIIRSAIDKKMALRVFPWQMKTVMFILERLPRWLYRKVMGMEFANYSKS